MYIYIYYKDMKLLVVKYLYGLAAKFDSLIIFKNLRFMFI